jgi:hypothetical protein
VVLDTPTVPPGTPTSEDLGAEINDPRVVSVLTAPYKLQDLYDAVEGATRQPGPP